MHTVMVHNTEMPAQTALKRINRDIHYNVAYLAQRGYSVDDILDMTQGAYPELVNGQMAEVIRRAALNMGAPAPQAQETGQQMKGEENAENTE